MKILYLIYALFVIELVLTNSVRGDEMDNKNNYEYEVIGMTCSACEAAVRNAVSKVSEIDELNINLLTGKMTLKSSEDRSDAIKAAVLKAGYDIKDVASEVSSASNVDEEELAMRRRLIVSICFMIPLFYLSMGHMMGLPIPSFFVGAQNAINFAFTQFLLTMPILIVNKNFFTKGFKTLIHRAPNMDSLIAIGSSAAVIYGIYAIYKIGGALGASNFEMVHHFSMDLYFETAAMILTLITVGKYFEARSKGQTTTAIKKLLDLSPKTATVRIDGEEISIDISKLKLGDTVLVYEGMSVPTDGVVVQGRGSVDESAITGESLPVYKEGKSEIIGGTVLVSGYLEVLVTKLGGDTVLSQIVKIVNEAASSKAPISRLADKVSGIFVPVVIGIAIVTFVVWMIAGYGFEFAMSMAISVLVISCPCALGLATPTAIMVGTGKGASLGIIFKNATALEELSSVKTVLMDKTGTITKGEPEVIDICPIGISEDEFMKIALSVEWQSSHPLSKAVVTKAAESGVAPYSVSDFRSVEGRGVRCVIDGKNYLGGNAIFMRDNSIEIDSYNNRAEEFASSGKTTLYFADEGTLLGVLSVADPVKESSAEAISSFEQSGVAVSMLTGDNETTARAIANTAGIKDVKAGVLPADKERYVREASENGRVAMIGDGINDAPALTRADVGIAVAAGTDIAIESADVVLMKNDLNDAVTAYNLSRKVMRNIKQNLFWAFFYNALGIPVAAGVFYLSFGLRLNPMIGAAAMSFSSICVVTNALRLRRFKARNNGINRIELKREEGVLMSKLIEVDGMMCDHCKGRVQKTLQDIDGVIDVLVDLTAKTAKITTESVISDDLIKSSIENAGYTVNSISEV